MVLKAIRATKACLQLQALLFPRPSELRLAECSELDFDQAIWNIPAKRAKMRRDHACPLPHQAIAILDGLHAITGGGGAPLFSRPESASRAISENTMNAARRHMGFRSDEHTAHGFRATASTILNGRVGSPPMRSRVLWGIKTSTRSGVRIREAHIGRSELQWRNGRQITWMNCAWRSRKSRRYQNRATWRCAGTPVSPR